MSAAEEIRQAAARLRDTAGVDGHTLDSDSRELLDMVRILLRAREPLADWLESCARAAAGCAEGASGRIRFGGCDEPGSVESALAMARAINGPAEPGRALGGLIADHVTGRRT